MWIIVKCKEKDKPEEIVYNTDVKHLFDKKSHQLEIKLACCDTSYTVILQRNKNEIQFDGKKSALQNLQ